MKKSLVKNIALCAVFAALVFLPTAFFHIPVGMGQYMHFGDAVIYIAACVLPFPFGALAGSIGGGLADILSGFGYWAPFTVIIKALISLPMTSKADRILTKRSGWMSVLSVVISTVGYYISTVIIMAFGIGGYSQTAGSAGALLSAAAIDSLPGSLAQSVGSILIFMILAASLDKAGFKRYLKGVH